MCDAFAWGRFVRNGGGIPTPPFQRLALPQDGLGFRGLSLALSSNVETTFFISSIPISFAGAPVADGVGGWKAEGD